MNSILSDPHLGSHPTGASPVAGWVGPQYLEDLRGYLRTYLPSCARMVVLEMTGPYVGAVNLHRQILASVDIMTDIQASREADRSNYPIAQA